jgi:hypothetical protein
MDSAERVVIRNAATVVLAYMLGLRKLSIMSLRAQISTHTAANMSVQLVLVKGKALWHAVPATQARTGVDNLPSRFDLLQKWTALRHKNAFLFGLEK